MLDASGCYYERMKKRIESSSSAKSALKTFSDRVLQIALSIPSGRVTTYGVIARAAGGGGMASQSITGILSKAEKAGQKGIPYHRIVYSDGRIWVTDSCRKKRLALYMKEGIRIDSKDRIVDFADMLMGF